MSFPSLPSVQSLLRGFATTCIGSSIFAPPGQVPELAPLDTCPRPELSCHTTPPANTCCSLYPQGQILHTQFWDTDPVVGPSNSWTIHGLWPNYCETGYKVKCDPKRQGYDIREILERYDREDLISFMEKYMRPNRHSVDSFWSHEWYHHGTCVSTMWPNCYGPDYEVGEEVPVYFQKIVDLFKGLDTYKALAAAGITPSRSRSYTYKQVQDAIKKKTGFRATILCERGELRQVFYHFNVKGTFQDGSFVQTNPVTEDADGKCGSSFKYLPKGH